MQVARARVAEPVHVLGDAGRARRALPRPRPRASPRPPTIYPELVNGQAVVGVADRVVEGLLERLERADDEERAA